MKLRAILLSMIICSVSHAEELAFIGSPLSVELNGKSCMDFIEQPDPKSGMESICMDRAFNLKYEINFLVSGQTKDKVANFIGFYHYWGMPRYTQYEPALLVLTSEKGHLQLRYIEQAYKKGNDWWVCEEWPETEDNECLKESKASDVTANVLQKFNKAKH